MARRTEQAEFYGSAMHWFITAVALCIGAMTFPWIAPMFGFGGIVIVPCCYFVVIILLGLLGGRRMFQIAAALNLGAAAALVMDGIREEDENIITVVAFSVLMIALSFLGAIGVFIPEWMRRLPQGEPEKDVSLDVRPELRSLCHEIAEAKRDESTWAAMAADYMFQTSSFCVEFDAIEKAFTFSYYDEEKHEYSFQLTLDEVRQVAEGRRTMLAMRPIE